MMLENDRKEIKDTTIQGQNLLVEDFMKPPQQIYPFFVYCGG